jgi:hypothetical protein
VGPPLAGHGWSGDSARYVAGQAITAVDGNLDSAPDPGAWGHVRAWDSAAATQPEGDAALCNPKGYVNYARPQARVRAAGTTL